MKISLRILLINFIIIVLISAGSTFVFYSLTKKLISLQHSKVLLNSTNDFVFNFQTYLQEVDEDFIKITTSANLHEPINLNDSKIDFLFMIAEDGSINHEYYFVKAPYEIDKKIVSLNSFLNRNPNVIIKFSSNANKQKICYGSFISQNFLENLSKRIRAEIAVTLNNMPLEISNQSENEKYLSGIIKTSKELSGKNNFDIISEEREEADFYATNYHSVDLYLGNPNISFVIFSKLPEAAELRSNITTLLIIISFSAIALSLILSMLFTSKLRKQIISLSETADKIKTGDLKQRVDVQSKDELGQLGNTFNNMLDELERKENVLNEYSEFITIINQNPTLSEVSDVALTKIIKSIDFSAGRLSLVIDRKVKTISSYGIQKELIKDEENIDLYQRVIEKGETAEFHFDENSPKLHSGLLSLDIKYILVYPIVYSKKVIAILELASISTPKDGVIKYLDRIKEQLAIGLSNAMAFRQLENFVGELKKLNEEYQRQNKQISEQNTKLLELHEQLKEKANELEIQKEKAVESSVLKSQFLANMSHELKTPLNSVLGLTELVLNDKNLSASSKEKLAVVFRNGNRLMNLINDILNYSKTEAGKMQNEPEEFCVREIISEIEPQILPLAKDKNLNFIVHNELDTEILLTADRKKIVQIILNLLSNAIKFTERGIIVLRDKIIDNETLHFEIIDSGIGISNDNLQIIFEEFRQIDGTTTRKYNGTGLGLAICKKFTEVIGGELTCESEVGKGSIFKLSIPVKVSEEKKSEKELSLFEDKVKGTVLVVDDKLENQLFIGEYLTSKNYEVMYASSSDEMLDRISTKMPVAITINLLNKEENGIHILCKTLADTKTKSIPLVNYAIVNDLHYGYGFPVFDYYLSPLSAGGIEQSIRRYEKLTNKKIEKVVIIDDEGFESRQLKEVLIHKNIEVLYLPNDLNAAHSITDLKTEMIITSFSILVSDKYGIINTIKENSRLRNIPISVFLPAYVEMGSIDNMSSDVRKMVTNFKNYPLDILKVIKDRLQLEGGIFEEDSSIIWEEQKSEQEEKRIKVEEIEKKNIVLIVDDDADTLFTVGEMVKETGCEIVFANNGIECLSILRTMKPMLILLDIMMPMMDGFETIKKIRSEKDYRNIPVYAMTAKVMLSDKDVVIKNGFNDLIPKPVNSSDLIQRIEKLIQSRTVLKIKLDKN